MSTSTHPASLLLSAIPNFAFQISTVDDGNMSFKWSADPKDVITNRTNFLNSAGLSFENCVCMRTTDEPLVTTVTKQDLGQGMTALDGPIADALITNEPGVVLMLLTADCLPVVLVDSTTKAVGISHNSWKNTEAHLVQKTIAAMVKEFGCDVKNLQVVIGPGIHKESFAFENPIQKTLPGWEPYLTDGENGETSIDIVSYTQDQLKESGIPSNQIETLEIDTAANSAYFSHYRAVRTKETEGRFATICGFLE